MMYVEVGNDTYGAVQWVGTTRVATVFLMVGGLPVWPRQSVFVGTWRRSGVMVPLEGDPRQKLLAVAMRSIHRTSVWLSYVRAAACLPILVGAIGMIFGLVMLMIGDRPDIPPGTIVVAGAALVGLGLLIGVSTYWIAPRASERERAIRRTCDEVFGLAADPAMLDVEIAAYWAGLLELRLHALGIGDFLRSAENPDRLSPDNCRLVLMRVRAQIVVSPQDGAWERITDRLLPLVPAGRDLMDLRAGGTP